MRDKLKDEEYLRERYNKDNARYTKYMTTYQTKLSVRLVPSKKPPNFLSN